MGTHQASQKKSSDQKAIASAVNPLESRPFALQPQPQATTQPQTLGYTSHIPDFTILNPEAGQLPVEPKLAIAQSEILQAKLQTDSNTPNSTGLPDHLKTGIENLSGYSLDNVRVHYNSPKPAQLQALAYTQGTQIHVAPGQEEHLPHEAWHVIQQMQGKVKPTMQMKGLQINENEKLEKEADVMGNKAIIQRTRATPNYLKIPKISPDSNRQAPIQLMRVVRWMDAGKEADYLSKLAYNDAKAYEIKYREIIKGGKKKLTEQLALHGEGLLEDTTPFISVGVNPYSLSWGYDTSKGGVDLILQGTPHNVWFDVPDGFLFPGVTELSQIETELLVLLPPGYSLKKYVADIEGKPGIEPNRWQGMSTEKRQQDLKKLNPTFTRLVVRDTQEDEPAPYAVGQEEITAPWLQKQKGVQLTYDNLPSEIREKVLQLTADNWPNGIDDFIKGWKSKQKWALDAVDSTIQDNAEFIRKSLPKD
ncbi:DUF4157 domain-containing protein [Fortiea sp. LEGE XX443]|uniref:eCIS core domain-containing protein n=1 Tax=Fortiea sp. LEGE XX443 TaxID=1828611 RepID=UPI00187EDDC7|nr:DUF4157 domain-containing protein [Fortiea sp. LEGE XX443]MBE9006503.1 DUF4157 domain-containing protein [Fortiea sp. LEGE XX443]